MRPPPQRRAKRIGGLAQAAHRRKRPRSLNLEISLAPSKGQAARKITICARSLNSQCLDRRNIRAEAQINQRKVDLCSRIIPPRRGFPSRIPECFRGISFVSVTKRKEWLERTSLREVWPCR